MEKRGVFAEKSNWNILKLLKIRASEYGNREFIKFDSGSALSFKSLDELSDRMACKLLNIGLKEDENVFCLLKNSPEFLISLFAVMKTGAVFVPINTELRGQFLEHQYLNCEPKITIIDNSLLEVFKNIKPQEKPLKGTIITGNFDKLSLSQALNSKLFISFNDCLDSSNADNVKLIGDTSIHKVCAIMYTSGTTGPSKGVLLTHGHFFSYSVISAEVQHLTNKDTYYICMPLFHINALSIQCFAALYAGVNVYCVERFSPNRWLKDNISCNATVTNLLGVMTEFIFNTAESDLDKDHSLRHIGAVPIGVEWADKFEKRFDIKFFQGFGMTESGMSFYEKISSDKTIPGCAGYPIEELYEVKIANPENDEPLPYNKIGELLIRPKHPGIFSAGYYKMPEKTDGNICKCLFILRKNIRIMAKLMVSYRRRMLF
ncbi:AMP-binding protein [Paracoccaceae bacterium]|nr:AMP-binding protein [Paracoccaceae bacterium]